MTQTCPEKKIKSVLKKYIALRKYAGRIRNSTEQAKENKSTYDAKSP